MSEGLPGGDCLLGDSEWLSNKNPGAVSRAGF